MSMIGEFARISDEIGLRLLEDPKLIQGLLYPEAFESALPALATDDRLDIDKTWHGLHFIFTGTDWEGSFPENFICCGGRSVGKVDVGYGPARFLNSAEVNQVAEFLKGLTEGELKQRYRPQEMDEEFQIYPEIWGRDGDEGFDYLNEHFKRLREFIVETARQKKALLIFLS